MVYELGSIVSFVDLHKKDLEVEFGSIIGAAIRYGKVRYELMKEDGKRVSLDGSYVRDRDFDGWSKYMAWITELRLDIVKTSTEANTKIDALRDELSGDVLFEEFKELE